MIRAWGPKQLAISKLRSVLAWSTFRFESIKISLKNELERCTEFLSQSSGDEQAIEASVNLCVTLREQAMAATRHEMESKF